MQGSKLWASNCGGFRARADRVIETRHVFPQLPTYSPPKSPKSCFLPQCIKPVWKRLVSSKADLCHPVYHSTHSSKPETCTKAQPWTLAPFCSLYAISGSFNYPFGFLFNFPSLYFSAIGLLAIFRIRRNIPPDLDSIHKEPDSYTCWDNDIDRLRYGAITLCGVPFQENFSQIGQYPNNK